MISKQISNKNFSIIFLLFSAYIISLSLGSKIIDDAYITFRHSYNLVVNQTVCFNVQNLAESCADASTNSLYSLLLASIAFLTNKADYIPEISRVLSILLLISSVFLFYININKVKQKTYFQQDKNRLSNSSKLYTIIVSLIVFNPILIQTMSNGLEGPLVIFLSLFFIDTVSKGGLKKVFIFLVALYTLRPEIGLSFFIAFIVIVSFSKLSQLMKGQTLLLDKKQISSLIRQLFFTTIILTAISILRFNFTGNFLPNSVLAKNYSIIDNPEFFIIAIAKFIIYLFSSIFSLSTFLFLPLLLLTIYLSTYLIYHSLLYPSTKFRKILQTNNSLLIAVICSFACGISFFAYLKNGGDWMPGYRLFAQWVPSIFLSYSIINSELNQNSSFTKQSIKALTFNKKFTKYMGSAFYILIALASSITRNEFEFSLENISRPGSVTSANCNATRENSSAYECAVYLGTNSEEQLLNSASFEGLGLPSWKLRKTFVEIHDPLGLASDWLSKNGKLRVGWGKTDTNYTLNKVSPDLLVYHYPGHFCSLNTAEINSIDRNYAIKKFSNDLLLLKKSRYEKELNLPNNIDSKGSSFNSKSLSFSSYVNKYCSLKGDTYTNLVGQVRIIYQKAISRI